MLKQVNLNVAYPFIALSYPLVMILSYLILGERITGLKILGSFVIVGGIIMIMRF